MKPKIDTCPQDSVCHLCFETERWRISAGCPDGDQHIICCEELISGVVFSLIYNTWDQCAATFYMIVAGLGGSDD